MQALAGELESAQDAAQAREEQLLAELHLSRSQVTFLALHVVPGSCATPFTAPTPSSPRPAACLPAPRCISPPWCVLVAVQLLLVWAPCRCSSWQLAQHNRYKADGIRARNNWRHLGLPCCLVLTCLCSPSCNSCCRLPLQPV